MNGSRYCDGPRYWILSTGVASWASCFFFAGLSSSPTYPDAPWHEKGWKELPGWRILCSRQVVLSSPQLPCPGSYFTARPIATWELGLCPSLQRKSMHCAPNQRADCSPQAKSQCEVPQTLPHFIHSCSKMILKISEAPLPCSHPLLLPLLLEKISSYVFTADVTHDMLSNIKA